MKTYNICWQYILKENQLYKRIKKQFEVIRHIGILSNSSWKKKGYKNKKQMEYGLNFYQCVFSLWRVYFVINCEFLDGNKL